MRNSHTVCTVAVTAFLIAVSLLAFAPGLSNSMLTALEWVKHLGAWGPVTLIALYFAATVAMIPGAVLTLGAGAAFGVWAGFLAVVIGSNLGAAAAFALGRTLLRGWISRSVAGNLRFAALDAAVAQNGFRIVMLTRLSPLLPFNVLNYALGLTGISWQDYMLASTMGMLPGTLLFVCLGATARNLAELKGPEFAGSESQSLFVGGLLVTVLLTFYLTQIAQAALAKETQSENAEASTETNGFVSQFGCARANRN